MQVVYFFCLDYSDPGERVREREREGEREGRERDSGTSAFSLYDVVTVHVATDRCQPYTVKSKVSGSMSNGNLQSPYSSFLRRACLQPHSITCAMV